jgi:hypothetical protein
MTNLTDLTTGQLHQILAIKEQIKTLQSQIESIAGGGEVSSPAAGEAPRKKRRMSPTHRRKVLKALAKARKIRWAKLKGTKAARKPAKGGKRVLSAGHKAKLAAAAKARWAKARAEGKKTL